MSCWGYQVILFESKEAKHIAILFSVESHLIACSQIPKNEAKQPVFFSTHMLTMLMNVHTANMTSYNKLW